MITDVFERVAMMFSFSSFMWMIVRPPILISRSTKFSHLGENDAPDTPLARLALTRPTRPRSRRPVIPIGSETRREWSADWDWSSHCCCRSSSVCWREARPSRWHSWRVPLLVDADWVESGHSYWEEEERKRWSMSRPWFRHAEGTSRPRQWPHTSIAWRKRRSPSGRRNCVERWTKWIWSGRVWERLERDTRHSWSTDFARRPVSAGYETRRWRCQSYATSRWRRPRWTISDPRLRATEHWQLWRSSPWATVYSRRDICPDCRRRWRGTEHTPHSTTSKPSVRDTVSKVRRSECEPDKMLFSPHLLDIGDGVGHQEQRSFTDQGGDQHTEMKDNVRGELQDTHGQAIAMHGLLVGFAHIDGPGSVPTVELVAVQQRHFLGGFGEGVHRVFEIILALSRLIVFELLSLQLKDLLHQITLLLG